MFSNKEFRSINLSYIFYWLITVLGLGGASQAYGFSNDRPVSFDGVWLGVSGLIFFVCALFTVAIFFIRRFKKELSDDRKKALSTLAAMFGEGAAYGFVAFLWGVGFLTGGAPGGFVYLAVGLSIIALIYGVAWWRRKRQQPAVGADTPPQDPAPSFFGGGKVLIKPSILLGLGFTTIGLIRKFSADDFNSNFYGSPFAITSQTIGTSDLVMFFPLCADLIIFSMVAAVIFSMWPKLREYASLLSAICLVFSSAILANRALPEYSNGADLPNFRLVSGAFLSSKDGISLFVDNNGRDWFEMRINAIDKNDANALIDVAANLALRVDIYEINMDPSNNPVGIKVANPALNNRVLDLLKARLDKPFEDDAQHARVMTATGCMLLEDKNPEKQSDGRKLLLHAIAKDKTWNLSETTSRLPGSQKFRLTAIDCLREHFSEKKDYGSLLMVTGIDDPIRGLFRLQDICSKRPEWYSKMEIAAKRRDAESTTGSDINYSSMRSPKYSDLHFSLGFGCYQSTILSLIPTEDAYHRLRQIVLFSLYTNFSVVGFHKMAWQETGKLYFGKKDELPGHPVFLSDIHMEPLTDGEFDKYYKQFFLPAYLQWSKECFTNATDKDKCFGEDYDEDELKDFLKRSLR